MKQAIGYIFVISKKTLLLFSLKRFFLQINLKILVLHKYINAKRPFFCKILV